MRNVVENTPRSHQNWVQQLVYLLEYIPSLKYDFLVHGGGMTEGIAPRDYCYGPFSAVFSKSSKHTTIQKSQIQEIQEF